jgi:hypothetical protein
MDGPSVEPAVEASVHTFGRRDKQMTTIFTGPRGAPKSRVAMQ